jgi:hypothetical protein
MHTSSIQKQSPQTYQHFFNYHDIVISLPQTILFSGKSYQYTGKGNSLGTKIPMRIYLGAKFGKNRNKKINYIYKKHKDKDFENAELQTFYDIDDTLLQELGIQFEVNILAENNFFETEYILTLLCFAEKIYRKDLNITQFQ